jgi:hypothetical protein
MNNKNQGIRTFGESFELLGPALATFKNQFCLRNKLVGSDVVYSRARKNFDPPDEEDESPAQETQRLRKQSDYESACNSAFFDLEEDCEIPFLQKVSAQKVFEQVKQEQDPIQLYELILKQVFAPEGDQLGPLLKVVQAYHSIAVKENETMSMYVSRIKLLRIAFIEVQQFHNPEFELSASDFHQESMRFIASVDSRRFRSASIALTTESLKEDVEWDNNSMFTFMMLASTLSKNDDEFTSRRVVAAALYAPVHKAPFNAKTASAKTPVLGICYQFQGGLCRRGSSCRYSHEESGGKMSGRSQGRSQASSQASKCFSFASNGSCKFGAACRYNHDSNVAAASVAADTILKSIRLSTSDQEGCPNCLKMDAIRNHPDAEERKRCTSHTIETCPLTILSKGRRN